MAIKHYNLHIHGRVQGVWYRASCRDRARALNLSGFVRNEPDGSVYAEAEGAPDALDQLAAWCRQGPPRAEVERVEVSEGPLRGFEGFEVKR